MYYRAQPNLKRLTMSREAIEIVQSDTYLSEVFSRFGYTEPELSNGLTFQNNADVLYSRQDVEYGNQKIATEDLQALYTTVRSQLRIDRRIAGTILQRSSGLGRLLRLSLPLGTTYEAVLSQAVHFYNEIMDNEAIKAQLAIYSFTDETLLERLVKTDELSAAMKKQQFQIGEAQVATSQFKEAMGNLDRWMSQFIGVARQAFRDDPKQLKKLGIYVKG